MARFVLRGSTFNQTFLVACGLLAFAAGAPVALAQHGGGGHVGGGVHMGGAGVPHVAPGPSFHPRVAPPHFVPAPYTSGFAGRFVPGVGALRYHNRPIRIYPPLFPFYGFYGGPFYGFGPGWGWGWGFNSCWAPGCDLFWTLGLNYESPFYAYNPGYSYAPSYTPYVAPAYFDGDERADLPRLYLRDGTVYDVADYWLVDNQLHFTLTEKTGERPVEHVIDFDELDVQTTTDMAARRGFRFVLRNRPLQEYLQDRSNPMPPDPPQR